MGRPNAERYSPFKKRSPLSIISKKVRDCLSSASSAFRGGLRRSLSMVINNDHSEGRANFASLPMELLFQLFNSTSVEGLKCMSQVNNTLLEQVKAYVYSRQFGERFADLLNNHFKNAKFDEVSDEHKHNVIKFAQLIRMCHLFGGSRKHCFEYILQFFNKTTRLIGNQVIEHGCMACAWGILISEVSRDWSQVEFYALMQPLIKAIAGLEERVALLLKAQMADWKEELNIRRLLRGLFLDHIGDAPLNKGRAQELPFRLAALLHILAPDHIKHTHRLVLILGAPVNTGNQQQDANNNEQQEFVDYYRLTAEPIHDVESARAFLGELPHMVESLLATDYLEMPELRWNDLEVFNFLEMLTTHPEPWVLHNFAALLISAPRIVRVAVLVRAQHGTAEEAGVTLVSCIEVSIFLNYNPLTTLHETLNALTSKLSTEQCLQVLRAAVKYANEQAMESIPAANNAAEGDQQPMADPQVVHGTLEMCRRLSDLFLAHLRAIFTHAI